MYKTINDITIEDVSQAAQENSERYIDHVRKAAKQAFIEGVMWPRRYTRKRRTS